MKLLFFTITLFSTSIAFQIQAQEIVFPQIKVEAEYIGVNKTVIGGTTSIPPHYFYKDHGHTFSMTMSLAVDSASQFEVQNFGIVCIRPDKSVQKISLYDDTVVKTSPFRYEYPFLIIVDDGGYIEVFLASKEDMRSNSDVAFYQKTSNKQSLVLRIPVK